MNRSLLIGLLCLGLGLAGWVSADDPPGPAAENAEPPVRLKKKKKPAQDTPPPKGDEKPDPGEPGKKPEPPAPKPGDEDRLDDKDDLNLRVGEDEKEILERVARNARASEDRLANRELGEGTRQLQKDIVDDLDALIQKSKQGQNNQNQQNQQNQQQQNQQNQQNQQRGSSGGSSGQQSSREARRQRRNSRQNARRQGSGQQNQQTAQNNKNNEKPGEGGNNPGGGGTGADSKRTSPDRAFDLWGHLPEKERALMNKEMEQKFMDKYDELTKQYYRIIAEKSRRKK